MKKHTKKKIIYFVVAFLLTLLLGVIFLAGYVTWEKSKRKGDVAETAVVEASADTDVEGEKTSAEMSDDGEPAEETPEETADAPEEESKKETAPVEISEIEESAQEPGEVTMTFGGDICFHDPFANMGALVQRGGLIENCISAELLAQMRQSDICMVNNEFPYSDRGTPIPEKTFAFRSKPENVKLLHEMGVDIVSLANNHAYDHGEVALLDTLDVLEKANVQYVGAGRNLEEASRVIYFDINGVKIGVLAATQIERLDTPDTKGATDDSAGVLRCFSERELKHVLSLVEKAKENCDALVVYIHWGTENTDNLDWAQPYQADLISKAGADLIVGAHPHCLQGVDRVNGVPVIYSLGNYWFNSKPLDTALLKVIVNKEGVSSVQVIPARQQDCSTFMLFDAEKQRVLDYLQSLSPSVRFDAEGFISW